MNNHERALTAQLPEYLTIRQVADFALVNEQTVRRWIRGGQLRAFRLGERAVRIDRESVTGLFRELGVAPQ
jgi:excisionase family DNA binding protein